jgi:hypothetical protein
MRTRASHRSAPDRLAIALVSSATAQQKSIKGRKERGEGGKEEGLLPIGTPRSFRVPDGVDASKIEAH